MSHLNFSILAFSINFCPIKSGLSGNTVWKVASVSQKLVKLDHFCHFWWIFVHSKCKRSSLRSQCWMRLFGWFSNTVLKLNYIIYPPCFMYLLLSPWLQLFLKPQSLPSFIGFVSLVGLRERKHENLKKILCDAFANCSVWFRCR